MKDWTIEDIKMLTEKDAKTLAIETLTIKEHNVYLIDFAGCFGYSMCIFKDGMHVHYANDYELHHRPTAYYDGMTRSELRGYYIKKAGNILFTENEIAGPIADYDEYTRKEHFLRSYYNMRVDYLSAFLIAPTKEEEKTFNRKKARRVYDPISFCYVKDANFVKHHIELFKALQDAKKAAETDFEYMKKAFLQEMYNHEYGINWQADFDTLSAFGNIENYRAGLDGYFKELGFDDTKKRAYFEARKEYFEHAEL